MNALPATWQRIYDGTSGHAPAKRAAFLRQWLADGIIDTIPEGVDLDARPVESRPTVERPRRSRRAEKMPSLVTRAKNTGRAAAKAVGAAVKGKRVLAPAEVVAARKAACKACDKNQAGWCGLCGCKLAAKQKLATESCPLGLWPSADDHTGRVTRGVPAG